MVDIRKAFPSKYMRACDQDQILDAQITAAELETFRSGDPALMLTLRHSGTAPKKVRCNQTNRDALAAAWGWNTEGWISKRVELSVVPTGMGPGIRIRPLVEETKPEEPRRVVPPTRPQTGGGRIEDDSIPFGPR